MYIMRIKSHIFNEVYVLYIPISAHLTLHCYIFPLQYLIKCSPFSRYVINIKPAAGELVSVPLQYLLSRAVHLNLCLPALYLSL